MEPKAKKHFFVGYNTESTGYSLYDPDGPRVVVSRDVVFDETTLSEGDQSSMVDTRLGDPGDTWSSPMDGAQGGEECSHSEGDPKDALNE